MSRSFNVRNVMFLVLVGAVAAAGCGHGWKVVRDGGSPSPLKGAGPITVSFDYSRLIVEGKSEKDFVEAKKAEKMDYETSWNELKKQLETNFVIGMGQRHPEGVGLGPQGPTGVHAVVYPTNFTMGHYMVVASTNTSITAEVAFFSNGQPRMRSASPARWPQRSTGRPCSHTCRRSRPISARPPGSSSSRRTSSRADAAHGADQCRHPMPPALSPCGG